MTAKPTSAARAPMAWGPLLAAALAGAALAGIIGWRLNLQGIDAQVKSKRSALKKLMLSGGIPPTQEVMDYLTAHQLSLERRYQHWLEVVASPPLADAAQTDPQLYFQEQFHEMQRTLERLAAARGVPAPEQLGFPKELPPSDTVNRLLVQLVLIKDVAALVLEQGVSVLSSLKVEDPEAASGPEGEGAFLMRLPVRVRLTGSLPQVMKVLGAVHRARPLIDVRSLRIALASSQVGAGAAQAGAPAHGRLDAELVLARYLVLAAAPDAVTIEPETPAGKKPPSQTKPRAPRPARPRRKEP